MKVAFLGLGVMGFPMAGHLATAGHLVHVFNRSAEKAENWARQFEGRAFLTIPECVDGAELVFACVGNDDDSLEVAQEAISAMAEDTVFVDHTTTSSVCALEIAKYAGSKKISFVDAPVSGGEAGAINGALSVMCGGNEETVERISPVIDCYAKKIIHVGEVGKGQLCKSVNQIAIAGLLQGLSEAVRFAETAELDMDKTLSAVAGGAAQSWQMENRWGTMIRREFDFGFAVDWMIKDLDIVGREAERLGLDLPITQEIRNRYSKVSNGGGSRWDTSSLITLLDE